MLVRLVALTLGPLVPLSLNNHALELTAGSCSVVLTLFPCTRTSQEGMRKQGSHINSNASHVSLRRRVPVFGSTLPMLSSGRAYSCMVLCHNA